MVYFYPFLPHEPQPGFKSWIRVIIEELREIFFCLDARFTFLDGCGKGTLPFLGRTINIFCGI
jgi:hypothetical protein